MAGMFLAVLKNCIKELTLSTEATEDAVTWKGFFHACFAPYLALNRQMLQLTDESDITLNQCIIACCRL